MSLSEKDCYKKGLLWGVTILDVSKKINSLDDALDWLNIMNKLAEDTDKTSKKDDRGMKLIRKEIGNKKLISGNFKTFPQLINLVATLNRIKKGSSKAWFGRTKQTGFQTSLSATKERVIEQICDTISTEAQQYDNEWKDFYSYFRISIISLFKNMQNEIEDGAKALKTLCKKLNYSFQVYIERKYFTYMTWENYTKARSWINSKFKEYFGGDISDILLMFLPRIMVKPNLQFPDLNFEHEDMNLNIKELNKFIDYIKNRSTDINKNEDFWTEDNTRLVKELIKWFKAFDVSNSYTAPNLKNDQFYVLTDLWQLLVFVRGIQRLCLRWSQIACYFDAFLVFLYQGPQENSQCQKSIDCIFNKTENCPKSATILFNNIRELLQDKSDYYTGNVSRDYLKSDIDDFKQKFKGEINDFKSKNELTEEQYKNCLFPFLDRMNCYFDKTPLLGKLKIKTKNGEINYKY